jgi:hypothetical protein
MALLVLVLAVVLMTVVVLVPLLALPLLVDWRPLVSELLLGRICVSHCSVRVGNGDLPLAGAMADSE